MVADALVVNAVSKTYGEKRVVRDVSFQAKAGEIMGILGPNGAGKTTIIRMIMGITAPDSGTVAFQSQNRKAASVPKDLVGYLPEERGLYKEARVMHILQFLASLKNVPKPVVASRAREEAAVPALPITQRKGGTAVQGNGPKKCSLCRCPASASLIVDEPLPGLIVSQDPPKRR